MHIRRYIQMNLWTYALTYIHKSFCTTGTFYNMTRSVEERANPHCYFYFQGELSETHGGKQMIKECSYVCMKYIWINENK